jgi:SAM-dependent methyltransferase
MKEMWNQRYESEEYAYGTAPNMFFKDKIASISPGRLLLPAEGEGRNAVFAAALGWDVTAFDFSEQAERKARKLAEQNGVQIKYFVGDITSSHFDSQTYDAAGLIYAHISPEFRERVHLEIMNSLKPGGYIILEAFNKNQIGYNSGGPKNIEMLYSAEMLIKDFKALDILILEELTVHLSQGSFHQGESAIIRLFGRKRKS